MEYVNTMCNQCCSEMECKGGVGKWSQNKSPSYFLSWRKDISGKAARTLKLGFHRMKGDFFRSRRTVWIIYTRSFLKGIKSESLNLGVNFQLAEDPHSHLSSPLPSLGLTLSTRLCLQQSPCEARRFFLCRTSPRFRWRDSLPSRAQVLIWCPIKSD